jgi:Integrase core domain
MAKIPLRARLAPRAGLEPAAYCLGGKPEPGQKTQYTSAGLAGDFDVELSHGRTGQCCDNALAESFFGSLKGELIDLQAGPTQARARRAVTEYIGWYNATRLHSSLGYLEREPLLRRVEAARQGAGLGPVGGVHLCH